MPDHGRHHRTGSRPQRQQRQPPLPQPRILEVTKLRSREDARRRGQPQSCAGQVARPRQDVPWRGAPHIPRGIELRHGRLRPSRVSSLASGAAATASSRSDCRTGPRMRSRRPGSAPRCANVKPCNPRELEARPRAAVAPGSALCPLHSAGSTRALAGPAAARGPVASRARDDIRKKIIALINADSSEYCSSCERQRGRTLLCTICVPRVHTPAGAKRAPQA
jgi:hypothetical protein